MLRVLVCLLFAVAAPAQTFREYSIPTPSAVPEAITLGPDGNVCFRENNVNKIGRLPPPGPTPDFPFPTPTALRFGGISPGFRPGRRDAPVFFGVFPKNPDVAVRPEG